MLKIHLDTDIGSDMDDLCALALLLRWPDEVELTGITTVSELSGKRAGYVYYVLGLEGRTGISVAAGADVSGGYYSRDPVLPQEERYWPEPILPSPGNAGEAVQLIKKSIDAGAALLAIGPYTNLYLLEREYPGILAQTQVFLMGGFFFPVREGFPQWLNRMDYNIQIDVKSAQYVIENSTPTLTPLNMTAETALRRAYLPALSGAGALGQLIVRQAEAFAQDENNEGRLGKVHPGLPEDIINSQHDPLATAIALGWRDGVEINEYPVITEIIDGYLVERVDPSGKPVKVVTRIDGPRFNQMWFDVVAGKM